MKQIQDVNLIRLFNLNKKPRIEWIKLTEDDQYASKKIGLYKAWMKVGGGQVESSMKNINFNHSKPN